VRLARSVSAADARALRPTVCTTHLNAAARVVLVRSLWAHRANSHGNRMRISADADDWSGGRGGTREDRAVEALRLGPLWGGELGSPCVHWRACCQHGCGYARRLLADCADGTGLGCALDGRRVEVRDGVHHKEELREESETGEVSGGGAPRAADKFRPGIGPGPLARRAAATHGHGWSRIPGRHAPAPSFRMASPAVRQHRTAARACECDNRRTP
jgi:hypothetical protein